MSELPALSEHPESSLVHTVYSAMLYLGASLALPIAAVGALASPRWRYGWAQRFGHYDARTVSGRPLWLHAASIGEVRAAWPLLAALREEFPRVPLFVTTTTPEGHRTATDLGLADGVALFPFDLPHTIARTLARVQPRGVVVLETELWPNFLRQARRRGVAAILVNGRISDRSYPRYRRFRGFFRRVLRDVRFAGMQSDLDLKRILELGAEPERAGVMGNLKFDTLRLKPPEPPEVLRRALGAAPVVVAGSIHPGELAVLLDAFERLGEVKPDVRIVLAPRHLHKLSEFETALDASGLAWVRRSTLDGVDAAARNARVVLLDTTGELTGTYALAGAAFIGGSLIDHGGQNPLEALWHGVPVVHGPSMTNFREITDAMASFGVSRAASEAGAIAATLNEVMEDALTKESAERARAALADSKGAVRAILDALSPLMREEGP